MAKHLPRRVCGSGFDGKKAPKDVNAMLKSILVTTANGKPQTASSRLPFAVNAVLKVSIIN